MQRGTAANYKGCPPNDSAYPPKFDESMMLIIPDAARKEDRLLSRLQQLLGALLSLQEFLAKDEQIDRNKVESAVRQPCCLTLMWSA